MRSRTGVWVDWIGMPMYDHLTVHQVHDRLGTLLLRRDEFTTVPDGIPFRARLNGTDLEIQLSVGGFRRVSFGELAGFMRRLHYVQTPDVAPFEGITKAAGALIALVAAVAAEGGPRPLVAPKAPPPTVPAPAKAPVR